MNYVATSLLIVASLSESSSSSAVDCASLCNQIPSCRSDPHHHGSYCKFWQTPPVCFGIYYRDASRTNVCFSPNDRTCPQALPVTCVPRTTRAPRRSTTTHRSTTRKSTTFSPTVAPRSSTRTTYRSSTRSTTSTTTTTTTTSPTTIRRIAREVAGIAPRATMSSSKKGHTNTVRSGESGASDMGKQVHSNKAVKSKKEKAAKNT